MPTDITNGERFAEMLRGRRAAVLARRLSLHCKNIRDDIDAMGSAMPDDPGRATHERSATSVNPEV